MFTRVLRSTAKLTRHHTQHVSGIRQFSSNSNVPPKTAQCRHFYRTSNRLQPPSSQKDKLNLLLLESKLQNENLQKVIDMNEIFWGGVSVFCVASIVTDCYYYFF